MKIHSPILTRFLKAFVGLTLLSIVLTILFYYSLPKDVYPEFLITSVKRCVKFVIAAGWTTLFLAVLAYMPGIIRILVMLLFFLPSAFLVYLVNTFKLRLDYACVANIAETNLTEFLSFFNPLVIGILLLYIVGMSFIGWFLKKLQLPLPHRWLFVVLACGVLYGSTQIESIKYGISPVLHMNYLTENLSLYYYNDAAILKELVKLDDAEVKGSQSVRADQSSPIVFLHIGESVRTDHASFNGYERETMPCVRKEFDAGNVISFPKCVSFSTSTRLSVLGILTPATVLDPVIRQGSFIPYLNTNGIQTLGFYSSMPKGGGYYDSSLMKITRKLHERIFMEGYSDTLHEVVAERISGLNGDAFVMYYGEGAHVPGTCYNHNKYSVFLPDSTKMEEDIRRVNSYDNCLVATDAFIGNAIEALKDKNAVYIYVADHGEMLGEDDYWSRNADCYRRKELRHVLCFIWASKRFQAENAELWKQLKENHERLNIISHDVFYHTILSLFGIQNDFYDKSCDLFSAEAKPFPTEMPEATEFGMLRFEGFKMKWRGTNCDTKAHEEKRLKRELRIKARLQQKE